MPNNNPTGENQYTKGKGQQSQQDSQRKPQQGDSGGSQKMSGTDRASQQQDNARSDRSS